MRQTNNSEKKGQTKPVSKGEKYAVKEIRSVGEGVSPKQSMKGKKKLSLLFGGAAVLWIILLNIFPLPFYSLFFESIAGSNAFLVLLAVVITFPTNLLFSKILKADIDEIAHAGVNVIFMLGVVYTYSIFRYTAVWWLITAIVLHCAVTAVLFTKAKRENIPKVKEKSSTLRLALFGIVCGAASDFIYLLLFTLALRALLS